MIFKLNFELMDVIKKSNDVTRKKEKIHKMTEDK